MRTRKIIFIDGIKTRAEIKKVSGKGGMSELCRRLGVSQPILSDICIHGYGTEKAIKKFKAAGIPIIISDKPVPSRQVKEYTKTKRPELTLQDCGIKTEEQNRIILPFKPATDPPRQITLAEIQNSEIKELLISHLTALIEDLKKI